jgi:WD repeat-containing protein 35
VQNSSTQGLTENQNRLLYMIDLYTHKATGADDKNEWMRKPALMVSSAYR